jgi:hypothetical protein
MGRLPSIADSEVAPGSDAKAAGQPLDLERVRGLSEEFHRDTISYQLNAVLLETPSRFTPQQDRTTTPAVNPTEAQAENQTASQAATAACGQWDPDNVYDAFAANGTKSAGTMTPQEELKQLDPAPQELGIDPRNINLFHRVAMLL